MNQESENTNDISGEPSSDHGQQSSSAGPTTATQGTQRQLRRSRENRVLGGVCGGVGRYVDVDPVLFRLAFLLLVVAGGAGILLYIIAWIVIPEFSSVEEEQQMYTGHVGAPVMASTFVGGALVVIGLVVLLRQFVDWFDFRVMAALVLIGIGMVVVMRGMKRE